MRRLTSSFSLATACVLVMATCASAQPSPAVAPVKTDDAAFAALMADNAGAMQEAQPATHFSCETKVGVLLDNAEARSVLAHYLPGVVASPQIGLARGMTLKQLAGFKQAGIDGATLKTIDGELTALPPE